jgi:hypothetical protein
MSTPSGRARTAHAWARSARGTPQADDPPLNAASLEEAHGQMFRSRLIMHERIRQRIPSTAPRIHEPTTHPPEQPVLHLETNRAEGPAPAQIGGYFARVRGDQVALRNELPSASVLGTAFTAADRSHGTAQDPACRMPRPRHSTLSAADEDAHGNPARSIQAVGGRCGCRSLLLGSPCREWIGDLQRRAYEFVAVGLCEGGNGVGVYWCR